MDASKSMGPCSAVATPTAPATKPAPAPGTAPTNTTKSAAELYHLHVASKKTKYTLNGGAKPHNEGPGDKRSLRILNAGIFTKGVEAYRSQLSKVTASANKRSKVTASANKRSKVTASANKRSKVTASANKRSKVTSSANKRSKATASVNKRSKVTASPNKRPSQTFALSRVLARSRPLFQYEAAAGEWDSVTRMPHGGLALHEGTEQVRRNKGMMKVLRHHVFDKVQAVSTDAELYQATSDLLSQALRGKMSTIFMYGMTGSGKTYSMDALHRQLPVDIFAHIHGAGAPSPSPHTAPSASPHTPPHTVPSTSAPSTSSPSASPHTPPSASPHTPPSASPPTPPHTPPPTTPTVRFHAYELLGKRCFDLADDPHPHPNPNPNPNPNPTPNPNPNSTPNSNPNPKRCFDPTDKEGAHTTNEGAHTTNEGAHTTNEGAHTTNEGAHTTNEGAHEGAHTTKREVFLRVGSDGRTNVRGITEHEVASPDALLERLRAAVARRETSATGANATSSRSHAVYVLLLPGGGRLTLIDLAGSEAAQETLFHTKEHMMQCKDINNSLATLRACLRARSVATSHVPYRESTLTRVLKDALTDTTAATALVACVSPACSHLEHSLRTLRTAMSLTGARASAVTVTEQELRDPSVVRGGPKHWTADDLATWLAKQPFSGKVVLPEGMTGAAIMKLPRGRLKPMCGGDPVVAKALFQALRVASKDAARRDLELRRQLKNDSGKKLDRAAGFAKCAPADPKVAAATQAQREEALLRQRIRADVRVKKRRAMQEAARRSMANGDMTREEYTNYCLKHNLNH